ncbi:10519_t:CDS:2 [Funneliformis geosporum]|uniref:16731_t:CDS:1 n=1 Tax=Funneliformis geosporum TaxID=1117311 RepID=A0A9W4SQZ2_9GLOM|nr:10519_t:CDS:2 [Funneliformis geosporum]CAI2177362.1 16731_t:CDS:2 [Funneliformis geosporum]
MQALAPYFSDFYIQLEEPTRERFPGEEVRGVIILQSSKTVKKSAVRLKFKGKVKLETKGHDFHLFEKEIPVEELARARKKYQRFSFSLNLPTDDIPSSSTIQTVSWLSESLLPKCFTEIKVLDHINISNYPPPIIKPFQIEVKGKKKRHGLAHTIVDIPKGAIMRGESLPIRIHISHIVPIKNLEGVLIALYRRTKIILRDGKEEVVREVVASTVSPILIDPDSLETMINTKLTIPNDIPPTISNGKFFFVSYLLEVNVDLTIKKTIFESSSRIGKHDYANLRRKLGKYNGYFNIPLVIGTTKSNDFDTNNRQIDMQNTLGSCLLIPNSSPLHHARRSSEWTIISTNNSIDPSCLSISLPDSQHSHHGDNNSNIIPWDGIISPVPSAPSVEELNIYENDLSRSYLKHTVIEFTNHTN